MCNLAEYAEASSTPADDMMSGKIETILTEAGMASDDVRGAARGAAWRRVHASTDHDG